MKTPATNSVYVLQVLVDRSIGVDRLEDEVSESIINLPHVLKVEFHGSKTQE